MREFDGCRVQNLDLRCQDILANNSTETIPALDTSLCDAVTDERWACRVGWSKGQRSKRSVSV